jgi:hypothetical protein
MARGATNRAGRRGAAGDASGTKALAALENLVHLNPPVLFKYVAFHIKFDEALVEMFPATALPGDWQAEPPLLSTKTIGDVWVREARSAALALPSTIISGEPNFLLNPAHPDFNKVTIGPAEPFAFDPRLLV